MKRMLLLVTILATAGMQVAWGDAPSTLSYQGVLTDENGVVVSNGDYSLTFRLYDSESGGTLLWEETKLVTVTSGRFDVILGNTTSLDALAFDAPYWLAIKVGTDPEMTDRIELTSVAYSFFSKKVADSPGVASDINSSVMISDLYTTLGSRTITVPSDGYVLAIGTAEVSVPHETGGPSGSILEFGITDHIGGFPPNQDVMYRIPPVLPTEQYVTPVTVHGLFEVSEGSHTLYFVGVVFSGASGGPVADDIQFSLAFFPTAYGTVEPTAILP